MNNPYAPHHATQYLNVQVYLFNGILRPNCHEQYTWSTRDIYAIGDRMSFGKLLVDISTNYALNV